MSDRKKIIRTIDDFENNLEIKYLNSNIGNSDTSLNQCTITMIKDRNYTTPNTFLFTELEFIERDKLIGSSGLMIHHVRDMNLALSKEVDEDFEMSDADKIEIWNCKNEVLLVARMMSNITPRG